VPTNSRREDILIERFLSAYESGTWVEAEIDWLDKRLDAAVEALVTRRSDGRTLAIEHTIIEPFVGEKEDFAFFKDNFLRIEQDHTLLVPGRYVQLFVPVGSLRFQHKRTGRDRIVSAVHSWLKANRLSLPEGYSEHSCAVTGISNKPKFDVKLYIRVTPFEGAGILHVRRVPTETNLDQVVAAALRRKVPKLVKTVADRRILLFERQHMNLLPKSIFDEVEKLKETFPDLAHVHEFWIVETIFYGTPFGGTYLRFEQYEDGIFVRSLDLEETHPSEILSRARE
jgi:hypothetical protein